MYFSHIQLYINTFVVVYSTILCHTFKEPILFSYIQQKATDVYKIWGLFDCWQIDVKNHMYMPSYFGFKLSCDRIYDFTLLNTMRIPQLLLYPLKLSLPSTLPSDLWIPSLHRPLGYHNPHIGFTRYIQTKTSNWIRTHFVEAYIILQSPL